MTSRKPIRHVAQGKHIGHAVESHCRGLLARIATSTACRLARAVDIGLSIETDAVLVTEHNKVRAIVIVAFNSDSDDTERRIDHSSHKFYRTRLEFNEAVRLFKEQPDLFDPGFVVLTVVYGTRQGWKPRLLAELKSECPPVLFVPDDLGDKPSNQMIANAFAVYEQAGSNRTEAVARHFSEAPLPPTDKKLMGLMQSRIDTCSSQTQGKAAVLPPTGSGAGVVDGFRSRLRQGLSLLSLFPNAQISAWLSSSSVDLAQASADLSGFIRRAFLLDLVQVSSRKTLSGLQTRASARSPFKGTEYLPHRPDFEDWRRIEKDALFAILDFHRDLPLRSSSFHAGGQDQAFANLKCMSRACDDIVTPLASSIVRGSEAKVRTLLTAREGEVSAEPWHPCAIEGFSYLFPWSLVVAALATVNESRADWRRYRFRVDSPTDTGIETIVEAIMSQRRQVASLLKESAAFVKSVNTSPLRKLSGLERPVLFNLDVSTSWVAAIYLAITSNPSHNPLSYVARRWCDLQSFSSIDGYPTKRGKAVAHLFGGSCRLEWTISAVRDDGTVVIVEPRSITANHMRDKAKEVCDRLAQTRVVAKQRRVRTHFVGILDGDFDAGTLSRFASRIGYDEILPADTVIAKVFGQEP